MSKNLFAPDSDSSEENLELKLNKEYAKSYNKFRQKELYQKLKDQDKNNSDSSSSTDSDSTDEDDELINPKFDQDFFKTLSSLKSKDPKIYDQNTSFFENITSNDNNDNVELRKSKISKKPLTLKDYERKVILEKDGKFEDDSESEDYNNDNIDKHIRSQSPSYAESERKLKQELKKVIDDNDNDSEDEEFGGIFKKRQKTAEQKVKEEEEYTKWLTGGNEDIEEATKKTLNPLKEYWNNPKLPRQEIFLRDYILNKGYVDKDCHEIPTYDEIVGNEDNLSADEQELEKQAEFEHKYNFRYEEPDQEFIKRYPRTIDNSVRKTNDNRREKRLEIKERKQREKNEKMKELEILKEMKRQEIEEKIKKLKEVTGNDQLPFENNEFDDDFDPVAHDRKMQEIFNDDYYGIEEDGEEKPECPDMDELKIDDWDNYDPDKDNEYYNDIDDDDNFKIPNCEDDDFIMDCDYNPNSKERLQNELIENTKDRRKRRKKRNEFKEMIKKEKPVFNPEDEKTYEEYINEYYKMDCEDIIGDLPCRFKYTETVPNDFGLTIEEILLAKNKELNQWASLKKATQIRSEHVEKNERRLYEMKAQNLALKKKIFASLYGSSDDEVEEGKTDNKSSNKEDIKKTQNNNEMSSTKKNRKNKKRKASEISEDNNKNEEKKLKVDNESLNHFNVIPEDVNTFNQNNLKEAEKVEKVNKKKKNKKKKQNITFSNEINNTENSIKKIVNENNKLEMSSKSVTTNPFLINQNNNTITTMSTNENNNKFKLNANKFKKIDQLKKNDLLKKTDNFKKTDQLKKMKKIDPLKKTDQLKKIDPLKKKKQLKKIDQLKKNHPLKTDQLKKIDPLKKIDQNNLNKNKIKNKSFNKKNEQSLSDERLKAYGINPKKYNKKQNYINMKNNLNKRKEHNLNNSGNKVHKKQKGNVKHKSN